MEKTFVSSSSHDDILSILKSSINPVRVLAVPQTRRSTSHTHYRLVRSSVCVYVIICVTVGHVTVYYITYHDFSYSQYHNIHKITKHIKMLNSYMYSEEIRKLLKLTVKSTLTIVQKYCRYLAEILKCYILCVSHHFEISKS